MLRAALTPFLLFLIFGCGGLFFIVKHHVVDLSALEQYNPSRPSILLDNEGNEWARFELDRRKPVVLEKMPSHLINAFVAAEDWKFFSHSGISIKGIIRSIFVNIYYGTKKQGASTITQQLVKLLFFNTKKTFKRKIKEQLYAFFVEQQFSKEQILQTYLNHLYFGCGIYGVEAASQRFWGKSVSDLTLDESATLAAVIRSPGSYSPLLCPLSARYRRNVILQSMKKLGFIADDECVQACEQDIHTLPYNQNVMAPHLKESIRIFLEKQVGKYTLYCGGLKIQTTVNQKIQRAAEDSFAKNLERTRVRFGQELEGGLVTVDAKTGEVRALVGGADFNSSQVNRALGARRQMGSIFKPLVYAAAVEKGYRFTDTEIDEPISIAQDDGSAWEPQNHTGEFEGEMTLARALSLSNNMITIKTLFNVGIDNVITLAKKCHLPGPFNRYPSLALGCIDSTLIEATGAFNVFANSGYYVEPHMIKWVKDQWGTKIYKATPARDYVIHSSVSSQVAKVLTIGINRYQKRMGSFLPVEAFGKTGTTNDWRTSWFAGSTPELTTVIYVGRDDNKPMGNNAYPIHTAFPIWFDLHRAVSYNKKQFDYDPQVREVSVDWYTGQEVDSSKVKGAVSLLV